MRLFLKDADFEAFERVLEKTLESCPMRVCAYCLLSEGIRGRESLIDTTEQKGSWVLNKSKTPDPLFALNLIGLSRCFRPAQLILCAYAQLVVSGGTLYTVVCE
jgi:hypothetical protein